MQLSKLHKLREKSEPIWHITLAITIAMGLQLILKDTLLLGLKYVIVSLELVLIMVLLIPEISAFFKRLFGVVLVGTITLFNVISLVQVARELLSNQGIDGRTLLISAAAIYLTNIIVFGILYWELDNTKEDIPDFAFSQASRSDYPGWRPTFFDYLYISTANVTSNSPSEGSPLTHRAKFLMSAQGIIALVTIVIVITRAVSILGS